ncbi:MAG TPA: hypothetical protein VHC95_06700 [Opitutales bacterium]|nr:hypothetical protein [Opitutales bacterium]
MNPPKLSPSGKDTLAGLRRTVKEVSQDIATGELPDGWRRKIIEIWRDSLFAEMHEVSSKPHTRHYILGFSIGFFLCYDKITHSQGFTAEEQAYFSAAVMDSIQGSAREGMAQMSSPEWRAKILTQAQNLPLTEAREFFDGFARGLNAVFHDEKTFKHDHTTTRIYMFLMQAANVDQFDTVEDIYAHAKEKMGAELPHSFESFQKLCNRIGLRGRIAQKRTKFPDTLKKPVQ